MKAVSILLVTVYEETTKQQCVGDAKIRRDPRIVMMPTLSLLATLKVVLTTTSSSVADDKIPRVHCTVPYHFN